MKRQARRKEKSLKKAREMLGALPKGWAVVCEGESVFIHDAAIKKVWALKRSRGESNITSILFSLALYP